ncbi:hypothetical protein JTE90_026949 [Oedothorax gibbosus]|uniref:Uncharacterized protein n=1 Tax=Oedothorax gibbosus TaxID=931172 RepID=A0AAV6UV42_9ARAC|nr:hypothetical protein JTE90_026949 [Oedothorax gibbosus]
MRAVTRNTRITSPKGFCSTSLLPGGHLVETMSKKCIYSVVNPTYRIVDEVSIICIDADQTRCPEELGLCAFK